MKYLVEKGANVHIQNNDGVSEWDHADSKLTTAVMHRVSMFISVIFTDLCDCDSFLWFLK